MNTTKPNTTTIDQSTLDRLLAVPAIQAALAESTAGEESTAAAARAAALDAKAEADRELAELTIQSDGLDVAIAQLEDEIISMKRDRYTVSIAVQRGSGRLRDLEIALRDKHGNALVTHVVNYLHMTADNATREAERQADLVAPAGKNIMGTFVLRPCPKAATKAAELREAAIGLHETADAIEVLGTEAVSPQELRRRIQTKLEAIGLTLYQGTLPEHMVSRQVHAQGPGQERSVELLAPKIAA